MILLALTDAPSSRLYSDIIKKLASIDTLEVTFMEASQPFIGFKDDFCSKGASKVYVEDNALYWSGRRNFIEGDRFLHLDIIEKIKTFIIAPCSANMFSKLALGICDNLILKIARAYPIEKQLIIAPEIDLLSWLHPSTKFRYKQLTEFGYEIVPPVLNKNMMNMASIETIISYIKKELIVTKEKQQMLFEHIPGIGENQNDNF